MLFIFDENFPVDFVKGFSILEKANRRSKISVDVVFSSDFMGKSGATDEEIIAQASKMEAVIVTHDSDFKRIKHYKPLLIQHNVGYIYFKVPKATYQYWDIVKAFVNKWEELKTEISKSSHPFAFEVSKLGQVNKLSF
jgi:predicted nuclease of predicted toxin-antitoxin system